MEQYSVKDARKAFGKLPKNELLSKIDEGFLRWVHKLPYGKITDIMTLDGLSPTDEYSGRPIRHSVQPFYAREEMVEDYMLVVEGKLIKVIGVGIDVNDLILNGKILFNARELSTVHYQKKVKDIRALEKKVKKIFEEFIKK